MASLKVDPVRSGVSDGGTASKGVEAKGETGFDDMLAEALGKLSQIQKDVAAAVEQLASGGDVVEAVAAMEKAEMSFQVMVEVRNKLISAYEEVMRMQI